MGWDFAIGGGKREERGGKWGMRGREVGIEGAGSGDRVPPCPPPQCEVSVILLTLFHVLQAEHLDLLRKPRPYS